MKRHLHEILRIKKKPKEIALGFAIGTFIAILPTPFLNFIIAFIVVAMYPRINKFAIFGAIILFNPFVLIPFYTASYWIGNILFFHAKKIPVTFTIWSRVYEFTLRFIVGSLIVALITSITVFLIVYLIAYKIKKRT